jgi:hypothetical protein
MDSMLCERKDMRKVARVLILLLVGAGAAQLAKREAATVTPHAAEAPRAIRAEDEVQAALGSRVIWAATADFNPPDVERAKIPAPSPSAKVPRAAMQAFRVIHVVPDVAAGGSEPCS